MRFAIALICSMLLNGCSREETADERYERRLREIRSESIASGIAEMEQRERTSDGKSKSSSPSAGRDHLTSSLSAAQEEDVALAINLSGHLCGKFVGANLIGNMILAECQEYRTKPDHFVRYWVRGLGENQQLRADKAFTLEANGWTRVSSSKE